MPHTDELHCRGQSLEVSHSAELADLNWNGESEEFLLDCAASLALPYLWQGCQLYGTKDSGTRLGGGASDSEFTNSLLQGGSLGSKLRCRPFRAGYHPIAQLQRFEDLLAF